MRERSKKNRYTRGGAAFYEEIVNALRGAAISSYSAVFTGISEAFLSPFVVDVRNCNNISISSVCVVELWYLLYSYIKYSHCKEVAKNKKPVRVVDCSPTENAHIRTAFWQFTTSYVLRLYSVTKYYDSSTYHAFSMRNNWLFRVFGATTNKMTGLPPLTCLSTNHDFLFFRCVNSRNNAYQ